MTRPQHVSRRQVPRSSVVIVTGAAAVAVWLGLTAPNVSPVAPLRPVTAAAVSSAPTTAPNVGRGRGRP